MALRIIRKPEHIDALAEILRGRKLPLTVSWSQGAPLSNAQRRLSFQWYRDVSRQLSEQTDGEVRAECKVIHGAPILCAENERFDQAWQNLRAAMHHEAALKFVEHTELPVTSLMTVKQMSAYLDAVQRHYSAQGVRLTDPEALKYESEFR